MAYNTQPIVTDVDGNPVSQYYNPTTDQYEPVEGSGGGNKVVLYNADGTENNSLSLIPILEKLSELTGTVIDEQTRQSNEQQRITFYNQLVEMLNTGQLKGDKGDTGETGRGLEFDWDGTRLGVRVEGDEEYIYVDLRGPQGPPGEIENLTSQHIEDALGYLPVSPNDLEEHNEDEESHADIRSNITSLNDRLVELETEVKEASSITIGPTTDSVIPIPSNAKGQIYVGVKGNTVTQIVENGNLSDGITGWASTGGAFNVTNKELSFLASSQNQLVYNITPTQIQKYYFRGLIKSNSNQVALRALTVNVYHSGNGQYELLSGIATTTNISNETSIGIRDERTSGFDTVYGKDFMIVPMIGELANLTVEEMNTRFPHYLTTGTKSTLCSFRMQSKKSDGVVGSEAYVYKEDENGKIIEMNKLVNPTTGEVVAEDELNNGTLYKKTWTVLNVSSGTVINYADMATGGQFEAWGANGEHVVGVKGDTLAFAATKVIYQLAVSKKYENVVIGSATAYPEGSVYFEYGHYEEVDGEKVWIPAEAGTYTEGEKTLTVATNVGGELQSLNKAVSQQGATLIDHEAALLTLAVQIIDLQNAGA
ncbi:hypothetical protein [Defluviitalea saccharophila]|uniref:Uncharacterized protein n=1 Tax=Defluviitalea saccharophila TaxID=879970 RepID=A0ABZ2Y5K5_9FIRM